MLKIYPTLRPEHRQGQAGSNIAQPGKLRGRRATRLPKPTRLDVGIPITIQQQIAGYLTFADRANLCVANRNFYFMVGTMPIYRMVLKASHLRESKRYTPATQVFRAILKKNRLCMSYMAEAMQSVDRTGPGFRRMTFLWDASCGYWDHPHSLLIENRYIKSLADRQLLGYALNISDFGLWQILNDRAKGVEQRIDVLRRAAWGFCNTGMLKSAQTSANEMRDQEGLSPSTRKKAEVLSDLIAYGAELVPWSQCGKHLKSTEGLCALKELELLEFTRLLNDQCLLNDSKCVNPEVIVRRIMKLHENPEHTPHLRALAGITLARWRLENDTKLIDDLEMDALLKTISELECLRHSISRQAWMLRGSLFAQDRLPALPQSKLMVAVTAKKVFTRQCHERLPGYVVDESVWARDTLVRLKVNNVIPEVITAVAAWVFATGLSVDKHCSVAQRNYHASLLPALCISSEPEYVQKSVYEDHPELEITDYATETKVWLRDPPGLTRTNRAAIKLAEIYLYRLSKRVSVPKYCSLRVIGSLREVLESRKNDAQKNEAKLLLAKIRDVTGSLHISPIEAERFCTHVYYSPFSNKTMRHEAINLLTRL